MVSISEETISDKMAIPLGNMNHSIIHKPNCGHKLGLRFEIIITEKKEKHKICSINIKQTSRRYS